MLGIITIIIITAICLYFTTRKRFKDSPNIARFFYAVSIIAFYVTLFSPTADPFFFLALFDGVVAYLFWYFIGLVVEYFNNKKFNKAPLIVAEEIKKLSQLKDEGILTTEEFDQQKKKLLSK